MVTTRQAWATFAALLGAGAVGCASPATPSAMPSAATQPAAPPSTSPPAGALWLRLRIERCALVGYGVSCAAALQARDGVTQAARLEACVGSGDTLGLWPRLEGLAAADAAAVELDVWATPSPGARYCGAIIVSAEESLLITALD